MPKPQGLPRRKTKRRKKTGMGIGGMGGCRDGTEFFWRSLVKRCFDALLRGSCLEGKVSCKLSADQLMRRGSQTVTKRRRKSYGGLTLGERLVRLLLQCSPSRTVDGLRIAVALAKQQANRVFGRVAEALRLRKEHDPLRYSRVLRDLRQAWGFGIVQAQGLITTHWLLAR